MVPADRRAATAAAALVLGALLLGLSACASGSGSDRPITAADIARGRMLFQTNPDGKEGCGFCHAFAAARTTGPFGGSLDAEVNEFRRRPKLLGIWQPVGADERTIRAFVLQQIADPVCEDPRDAGRCMTKNLFTGNDARDVAAFVARCGGRSGKPGCKPVAGGMQGLARKGLQTFISSGCASCHWAATGNPVGPSLHGLYGSQVELRSGKKVTAGDRYLMRSILQPDDQIVKGYQAGFMSGRISAEHISAAQARALVAYIKALK
jgi:cytochrome c551/c552